MFLCLLTCFSEIWASIWYNFPSPSRTCRGGWMTTDSLSFLLSKSIFIFPPWWRGDDFTEVWFMYDKFHPFEITCLSWRWISLSLGSVSSGWAAADIVSVGCMVSASHMCSLMVCKSVDSLYTVGAPPLWLIPHFLAHLSPSLSTSRFGVFFLNFINCPVAAACKEDRKLHAAPFFRASSPLRFCLLLIAL